MEQVAGSILLDAKEIMLAIGTNVVVDFARSEVLHGAYTWRALLRYVFVFVPGISIFHAFLFCVWVSFEL